jgi:hypothetical protein
MDWFPALGICQADIQGPWTVDLWDKDLSVRLSICPRVRPWLITTALALKQRVYTYCEAL